MVRSTLLLLLLLALFIGQHTVAPFFVGLPRPVIGRRSLVTLSDIGNPSTETGIDDETAMDSNELDSWATILHPDADRLVRLDGACCGLRCVCVGVRHARAR